MTKHTNTNTIGNGYAQNLIMKKVKNIGNGVKVYYVFDYSLDGLEQIIVVDKQTIEVYGYFNNNFLAVIKNSRENIQYLDELLKTNNSNAYKENTYNLFSRGWRYKSHGDPKLKNILVNTKKKLKISNKDDENTATTELLGDILDYNRITDFDEYVYREVSKPLL